MPNARVASLLRRTYWLSIAAIAITAGTVAAVALVQRDSERWARHGREVVRMARRAQLLVLERAAGVRGFLLTGDSTSLAPDIAARAPLRATLDSIVGATADNPPQQQRARAYAAAIARWDSAFAAPAIAQRARLGPGAENAMFGTGGLAGKLLLDEVRTRYEEFEADAEALYQGRGRATVRLQTLNMIVAVLGLGALGVIQAALRRQVTRQATALIERQDQLESQAIELEEQASELEEQATELEAQTEELQETVKELRRKNEELDAFSASVAHDLRSPLRSIDGFSHLLLTDYASRLDAGGVSALTRIRANTHRMGELIDGLLTLARVSAGELRRNEVNLSAVAESIGDDLRRRLPAERSIEYVVHPQLAVRGDSRLLRVAVHNLVENAFKFTRARPAARVEVGATVIEGQRTFFVGDNGVGFDPPLRRQVVRRIRAATRRPTVRGHRYRAGDGPAHRGPTRRPAVGGVGARAGGEVLLHDRCRLTGAPNDSTRPSPSPDGRCLPHRRCRAGSWTAPSGTGPRARRETCARCRP